MTAHIPKDHKTSALQRPRPVPRPIRNPVALALLWASKTDPRLVAVCSHWAIATQCALGIFVCFTSLLAFGGMYYTLSTVNVPGQWPLWIAVGWTAFVAFLDREIVGGLDRTTAIVRPLLALALGTIVGVQIELFVFHNRVDQDLTRKYREENAGQFKELRTAHAELDNRRRALQTTLVDLRKQEADWGKVMDDELVGRTKTGRSGKSGPGPVFKNAQEQQHAVGQRIAELRRDLDQVEQTMPEERQRLEQQFQRQEIARVADFVSRYEALDRVLQSSAPLYRMSWFIMLTLILIEMMPSLLKLLTPRSDYNHLVSAEIRENTARIDEISERNYRLAMEHPERPELSVSEKFSIVRYSPVPVTGSIGREL